MDVSGILIYMGDAGDFDVRDNSDVNVVLILTAALYRLCCI